jgi:hypothetical protein
MGTPQPSLGRLVTVNIVEATIADVSLEEATQIAGVSGKTLRRAMRQGELPRRYILTLHGPQLVFARAQLEGWRARRTAPGRRQRHAPAAPRPTSIAVQTAVSDALRHLQRALRQSQTALRNMASQLEQQEQQLSITRATLEQLVAQVTAVEASGPSAAPVVHRDITTSRTRCMEGELVELAAPEPRAALAARAI